MNKPTTFSPIPFFLLLFLLTFYFAFPANGQNGSEAISPTQEVTLPLITIKPLDPLDLSNSGQTETADGENSGVIPSRLASQTTDEQIVKVPLFSESAAFSKKYKETAFQFMIPEGTVIEPECYLHLHISASDMLDVDQSTITLSINDISIKTSRIFKSADIKKDWWRVEIPIEYIKSGEINSLSLQTVLIGENDPCGHDNAPSNWIRFEKDSYLYFVIKSYNVPSLRNVYSSLFDNIDDFQQLNAEFVIPDVTAGVVNAHLLKIASAIGKNYPQKHDINFSISFGFPQNDLLLNKFYIGEENYFRNNNAVQHPQKLEKGEGYISLRSDTNSPNMQHVYISGFDTEGLSKATNFFSDINYLSQIDQKEICIHSVISPSNDNTFRQSAASAQTASAAPDLENFPTYFFKVNESTSEILVTFPKKSDTKSLQIASLFAVRAGQANLRVFDFSINPAQEAIISDTDRTKNMFFFGSFDDINLPNEVREALAIYPKDSDSFYIQDGLSVSPETLKGKVIFQAIRSPMNKEKRIFVLMYEQGVEDNVVQILSSWESLSRLDGKISIFSQDKLVFIYPPQLSETVPEITVYPMSNSASEKKSASTELNQGAGDITTILIFVGGILIILLILLLVFSMKSKKKTDKHSVIEEKSDSRN